MYKRRGFTDYNTATMNSFTTARQNILTIKSAILGCGSWVGYAGEKIQLELGIRRHVFLVKLVHAIILSRFLSATKVNKSESGVQGTSTERVPLYRTPLVQKIAFINRVVAEACVVQALQQRPTLSSTRTNINNSTSVSRVVKNASSNPHLSSNVRSFIRTCLPQCSRRRIGLMNFPSLIGAFDSSGT